MAQPKCPVCRWPAETIKALGHHAAGCRERRIRDAALDLYDVARLTLMFYTAVPWNGDCAAEWKRLTGHEDATNRVLCDFIRTVLAKVDRDAA